MADKDPSTQVSRVGVSLLDNLLINHEQILELITEDKLMELGMLAEEGHTLHEMATALGISFGEFLLARSKSDDFDKFCQMLETVAASKHLASARSGIRNPQGFSATAYDRVMGALGFTPHVSHVNVSTASDGEVENGGIAKVGFDVAGFMGKHSGKEPVPVVDITPSFVDPDDVVDADIKDDDEAEEFM